MGGPSPGTQARAPSRAPARGPSQDGQSASAVDTSNAAMCEELGVSEQPPPTPLRSMIGNVGYYAAREADFGERYHGSPAAPDYYLGYGDKYARRFTSVLRPNLSPEGQDWLDRTFVLLQTAIEDRLARDPDAFDSLEKDDDAFRAFAYATHPDAYLSGGLAGLGPGDLAQIALTPDLGDLATVDGVSQILDTGTRVLGDWGGRAGDTAGEAWDWATDW